MKNKKQTYIKKNIIFGIDCDYDENSEKYFVKIKINVFGKSNLIKLSNSDLELTPAQFITQFNFYKNELNSDKEYIQDRFGIFNFI